MLRSNEFITLKAIQHIEDLHNVGIAVQISRNSKYYFNREGLIITVRPKFNALEDKWVRYVWYTQYKSTPEIRALHDTIMTIDGYDYTVKVTDELKFEVKDINLFSIDGDRMYRSYRDRSVINVGVKDSTVSSILNIELPIQTIELPLPVINEFILIPLSPTTLELKWKGTNPGNFYRYRLINSWTNEPMFTGVANLHTYFYTIPTIIRGQSASFTLQVMKETRVFESQTISLLFPRVEFNIFSNMSSVLGRVSAIYTMRNGQLVSIAQVWNKRGGLWYTD